MKECERISSLYGELLDQQLSSHVQEDTLEHFRTCTDCREDFKWYGITVQALRNLEEVSPPHDFVAQLSSKLYARPRTHFYDPYLDYFRNFLSSPPQLPVPVGVATFVFLVAVGVVVYNHAPVPYVPQTKPMHTVKDAAANQPEAVVAVNDTAGMQNSAYHAPRSYARASEPTFSPSTLRSSLPAAAIPKSIAPRAKYASGSPVTLADRIGGDNLTVESPSVDLAIESIKRMLPDLRGKLLEEMTPGKVGEKVIGIRIPSSFYGHLTTELINHGTVAAGTGTDAKTPAPSKADSNNLILYIRFVQSHN